MARGCRHRRRHNPHLQRRRHLHVFERQGARSASGCANAWRGIREKPVMDQLAGDTTRPRLRKLLLATHEYVPCIGGIATYARELARAASEQGYRVEVFCPSYGTVTARRQESSTLTVTRFPGGAFRGSRDLLGFAWRLRAKVAEGYEIIHGADSGAQMALQLLARTVGLPGPFFLSAHGTEILLYRSLRRYRWLMHDVFRRAAHTVAVSRATAALVRSFDPALDPG